MGGMHRQLLVVSDLVDGYASEQKLTGSNTFYFISCQRHVIHAHNQ